MKVSILNFLFLYSVLENETFESFFAKSAKEEGGGGGGLGGMEGDRGPENSGYLRRDAYVDDPLLH